MGTWSKNQHRKNLVKIAQVLNVSVDYLVGNLENQMGGAILVCFSVWLKEPVDKEEKRSSRKWLRFMEEWKKVFEDNKMKSNLKNQSQK